MSRKIPNGLIMSTNLVILSAINKLKLEQLDNGCYINDTFEIHFIQKQNRLISMRVNEKLMSEDF